MNQTARQVLVRLVAERGKSLTEDALLCKALLGDHLRGESRREVNVLVSAVRVGVVALLADGDTVPMPALLARLARKLHDETGIAEHLARWGVESWALALGLIPVGQPAAAVRVSCLQRQAPSNEVDSSTASSRNESAPTLVSSAASASPRVPDQPAAAEFWDAADRELYRALVELRHRLAAERQEKRYQIFPDATLRELARVRPSTLERMRQINGIGDYKIRDFGDLVLRVIREHDLGHGPDGG